ncbi:MAG: cytochrome b/b6 domain-containing protein [Lysobacterales bacterium]
MKKTYVHPLPVRIWHWINALGFILLIVTGLQIRYTDILSLMSFESAVRLHNWLGFALMANYLIWLLFYLLTDKVSVYHPELDPKKYFRDTLKQIRYYSYGIFRGHPNPHRVRPYAKFNPLQKVMYQIVMLIIVPIQFGTGLLLWDVDRFYSWVEALGGVRVVSTVHVLVFIFFASFILIHVYLGSLGHTASAHFKAMVTGYEEEMEEAPPAAKAG